MKDDTVLGTFRQQYINPVWKRGAIRAGDEYGASYPLDYSADRG